MAYVNTSATPPHLLRACGAAANFTLTFWIKSSVWNDGQNAAAYLLDGTAASPTDGLGIEKHGVGGTLYYALGNVVGGASDYTAQGTSFTGWLFVALVVSGGTFTAYAGIEGGSPSVHATGSMGVVDNAYIHNPFAGPPTAAAKYAAMKTWTAALSAGEIAAEFGSKAPVRTSNIHSYLSGDNGSTVGTDQSGAGNNWTQVGTGFTTDTDLPAFTPLLSSLSPVNGATGVSVSTNLAATFGENVIAGTGNAKIYETVAPVSAPTVASRFTDTTGTADATTFTIDWTAPGGGFLLNDIIFIAVAKDDDDAITTILPSSDWKLLWNTNTGTAARVAGIFRRVPAGFSGTSIALVGDSESWAARGYVIQGADPLTDPVVSTPATGVSTAANPANVAFPWGTDPTLVIAICGGDGNASASAYPSGYANTGTHTSGHTTTGSRSWLAYAELASDTSGSEDPGAFTNTSEDWVAVTVAFRGAPTDTLVETIAITDGSKVSFSGPTVTIDPAATLTGSKLHTVLVDSGAILASDDSSPYLGITDRSWSFTTDAGSSSTVVPSGIRAGAFAGAFSVLVTSGATGIARRAASGAPTEVAIAQPAGVAKTAKAGASLDVAVLAPSGARSQAKTGAPTNDASVQPTGDISGLCGAASVVATPSLSGVRFAARSGAPALLALAQPAGVRSLATSGPSVEVGGAVIAPAGVRSLSTAGAPAVLSAAQLTGARARESAGAGTESAAMSLAGARSRSPAGATTATTSAAPSGARSLAFSGAGAEVAGSTVSPSAARSLAVAGASAVVPVAQLAASRQRAAAGATSEAPVVAVPGVRRNASSGACSSAATPLCSGLQARSTAGASTETTATAPTGARSLAIFGATVEVSGSIVSPAGVRSLAKAGAPTLATASAPTGIRPTSVAGPSVEVSGSVVSPAGVRSLTKAGACAIGAVATQLTGCRGATQSGAPSLLSLAAQAGIKGTATSGAQNFGLAVAPSGARAGARLAAPLIVSSAAIAGSRLLALMGASVESTAFVVSPTGIRGLSRSGASVELPASATTSASGIRSAAVSGAFVALAQSEVVSLSGIRSLARSGASIASATSSLATVPLQRRDIAFFHTETFTIKFRTQS
jgi:hypothetical protein